MKSYDTVVVGSGPAGGEAARRLRAAGQSVALVEKDGFGGVCPLRGCNPKKVLMAAAEARHAASSLAGLGIASQPGVDWPVLARFRDSFVEPISEQVENHYFEIGVDLYYGVARMTGPDIVVVGGEELQGTNLVLCPGMRPRPLDVPGSEHLSTSDDFLALNELPREIVFLGGGFIAMELAHIAAHCGARVSVFSRSQLLKGFDPELVEQLVTATREAGIDLRIGPTAQAATLEEGQIVLSLSDGTTKTCQMAVNCTGRIPDLDGLDLNAGTVAHSRHGIEVNDFLQSITNPAVYAAGDAADTPFGLTPTATIESIALAENILNGNTSMPDFEGVPSVCFTLPPIASAGLAVEMARQMNIPHRVKTGDLSQSFPWKRLGEQAGGYRLVLSEEEDRILGAHLFGHAAEELINTFAAFIRLKTPLSGLRKTVWAYPTCGYYLKYMLD